MYFHSKMKIKEFLFQKGLKSNAALTSDLHLTGLSKVATFTAIDLVLLHGRYHIYSRKLPGASPCMSLFKDKLNSVIEIEKQVKHFAVILQPPCQTNVNFFLFNFVDLHLLPSC